MKKYAFWFLLFTMVAWFASIEIRYVPFIEAAQDAGDLRNGWYKQFPPVSRAAAEAKIGCLAGVLATDGLKVDSTEIRSLPVGPVMPGESGFGPAEIVWTIDDHEFVSDATLTALSPEVAYVEIARAWNIPARRNAVKCGSPRDPILTQAPSPIGDATQCPDGVEGPCYKARGGPPLTFTDATGTTWRKIETGFFFNRSSFWVR